jgi:hypothetical protein
MDEQWEFWDFDASSSWNDDGAHPLTNEHGDHGISCPEFALETQPIRVSNVSSVLVQEQRDSNKHLFASSMFKPYSDRELIDELDDMMSVDSELTEPMRNGKLTEGDPEQTTNYHHDSTSTTASTTAAVDEFKPTKITPRPRLASSRAGALQQMWSPSSIADDHNINSKSRKKQLERRRTIAAPEMQFCDILMIEKNTRARARAA